jgi:hypothetical protein
LSFTTKESLKASGMSGFVSVRQLMDTSCDGVPRNPGVYVILRESQDKPRFLKTGVGGWFKDRDPNVSIAELESNWVEGASIVYIGKAGSATGSSTLHQRLKQLMHFGMGKKVGHWGGRLLWQLADHENLIVCWKLTKGLDAEATEGAFISEFQSENSGQMPYANLR